MDHRFFDFDATDPVERYRLMANSVTPRPVAFVTSAFSSWSGCRAYREDIAKAREAIGDGAPEVIVVESSLTEGARLAIYTADGRHVTTAYIGQPHRWLAPVGVADLNSDGSPELAYVDRPHLRWTLRIWQFRKGALHEIATLDGVTNHRIGDPEIGGGIRPCTGTPEMILASADWRRVLAIRLVGNRLMQKDIGSYIGRESLAAALMCRHQG